MNTNKSVTPSEGVEVATTADLRNAELRIMSEVVKLSRRVETRASNGAVSELYDAVEKASRTAWAFGVLGVFWAIVITGAVVAFAASFLIK